MAFPSSAVTSSPKSFATFHGQTRQDMLKTRRIKDAEQVGKSVMAWAYHAPASETAFPRPEMAFPLPDLFAIRIPSPFRTT
ncbi:MAG: hypothetical protein OXC57_05260 [Rhodobacteraceae bacterium]|nr:hypothetical protein [Paracoccaceae bacterium]